MTIHSSLRDVFDIYTENYPGKPCSGGSKRAFIRDQLIPIFNQLGQELPDDIIKDRKIEHNSTVILVLIWQFQGKILFAHSVQIQIMKNMKLVQKILFLERERNREMTINPY